VEDQSFFKTIKNTIRQFDTYEIADAKIELEIPDLIKLSAKTSEKGYFLFDKTVPQDLSLAADEEGWVKVDIRYLDERNPETKLEKDHFQGELLIPELEAEYGVISDIDDTILHTGVTSFFKLRLLKNSLLTNAYERIPLKGAPELYQKLHLGKSGKNKNPMFYLSNSPWNMYQYLKLFLDFNKFPKGPILLRNFTTPFDKSLKPEKPHKQKEIINILKTYPDLKFILIGDSGEHDASIYTDMAVQYPERILAIYLRSVDHKRQMQRVQNIVDGFETTPVLMTDSSIEFEDHARENGFIF
ncbi:MAG: phosphatase domain-containing protein, partial [Gillisia sp.]